MDLIIRIIKKNNPNIIEGGIKLTIFIKSQNEARARPTAYLAISGHENFSVRLNIHALATIMYIRRR
ncbi:hypothetical protein D3C84_471490 [compost metagenome]